MFSVGGTLSLRDNRLQGAKGGKGGGAGSGGVGCSGADGIEGDYGDRATSVGTPRSDQESRTGGLGGTGGSGGDGGRGGNGGHGAGGPSYVIFYAHSATLDFRDGQLSQSSDHPKLIASNELRFADSDYKLCERENHPAHTFLGGVGGGDSICVHPQRGSSGYTNFDDSIGVAAPAWQDCNGVWGGLASVGSCGSCVAIATAAPLLPPSREFVGTSAVLYKCTSNPEQRFIEFVRVVVSDCTISISVSIASTSIRELSDSFDARAKPYKTLSIRLLMRPDPLANWTMIARQTWPLQELVRADKSDLQPAPPPFVYGAGPIALSDYSDALVVRAPGGTK